MELALVCLILLAGQSYVTEAKSLSPELGWTNFVGKISSKTKISERDVKNQLEDLIMGQLTSTSSNSTVCNVCTTAVSVLVNTVNSIPSDDLVLFMLNSLCVESQIMPENVCHGSIYSQGPVLLYIARNMDLTPKLQEFCSVLLKDDCDPATGEEWLVPLPDTPKPPNDDIPLPHPDSPKLRILQLSDLHIDPSYVVGSESQCNTPMCCHDIVDNPVTPAGLWGSYHMCDTPLNMLDNVFTHIKQTHKDIDYIMYIGDAPGHDFWNQNQEIALNQTITATNMIKEHFADHVVYPVIGNHDNFPINCFPPKSADFTENEEFDITWLNDAMWEDWTKKWLPEELKNDDFFYTIRPFPGFRLITLHSNYFYAFNWWNFYFSVDPAGELAWLVQELQAAEDAGDKVHIAMHQPPGIDALKAYSHNFWRIINRYENTVRGIFAGHTHKDELQMLFDEEEPDRAVSMVYVAGSITTYTNYNPEYRIITVDGNYEGSTYAVLDIENYYMDLSAANSPDTDYTPTWKKLYSTKDAYQMNNLNPAEWKRVVDNFITDQESFDVYYKNLHRDSVAARPCDASCRRSEICSILSGDFSNRQKCEQLPDFENV